MNWLQLAIMMFGLLRDLRKSSSVEEFSQSPSAIKSEANGALLTWIWEHREELIAFAVMLFERFSKPAPGTPQAMTDGDALAEFDATIAKFDELANV